MDNLSQKCLFILEFLEKNVNTAKPFIPILKNIVHTAIDQANKVGLQFALRDLQQVVQDMPIAQKKMFLQEALSNNLVFKLKLKDELMMVKEIINNNVISNDFEYCLLKGFYEDLKASSKLSGQEKIDIVCLINSYDIKNTIEQN